MPLAGGRAPRYAVSQKTSTTQTDEALTMKNSTIGFIGGGNMAASLIGGIIAGGCDATSIHVSDPSPERRDWLTGQFGIHTGEENTALAGQCDVVVLAVKPQMLRQVCEGLAEVVRERKPLVISVAAGIRSADIERWLGGEAAVVRTMPNTPALLQSGATGLYANPRVSSSQKELAEGIMRAVGLALWLDEEAQMDAVTALSGSGPAYHFLVIEAMQAAGEKLGLAPETARLLALQTAFGAARMALESPDDAATLRQKVTSPGGTTERAIGILEEGGIRGLFEQAMQGAAARAAELADQLGGD